MTTFQPFHGIAGGLLIGIAAVLLMAGQGRILGASGILGGLLTFRYDHAFQWRAIFAVGMFAGALAAWAILGTAAASLDFAGGPAFTAISGVIVGFGVALGNGCTSGHGICGLARFSARSLAATITFMAAAIATVFIVRHIFGA